MNGRILVIWAPLLIGVAILLAGLTSGIGVLSWTGAIFAAAALLPLPALHLTGLGTRWRDQQSARFNAMKFLLFTGPFAGLPLVIGGVIFSLPLLLVAGGGVAIFSVLSAVHVAMLGNENRAE